MVFRSIMEVGVPIEYEAEVRVLQEVRSQSEIAADENPGRIIFYNKEAWIGDRKQMTGKSSPRNGQHNGNG